MLELSQQREINIEKYQNKLLQVRTINQNGETVSNNTKIEILEQVGLGHNAPKYIKFGRTTGFYKNSASSSNASFDNFEYIICQIGKKLGIKMAETYKLYKDDLQLGIISENVARDSEKLYMTSDIPRLLDSGSSKLQILIQSLNSIGIKSKIRLNKDDGRTIEIPIADTPEDIKTVIESFLTIIKEMNVSHEEYKEIRQDYFNMIILDFIINNVDRNKNNYGILISDDRRVRFAPLFDNSTIKIPSVPDNLQQINGFFINKSKLLECLYTNYYEDIKVITEKCFHNDKKFTSYVNNLCNEELTHDERQWFYHDTFSKYYSMVYQRQKTKEEQKQFNYQFHRDEYIPADIERDREYPEVISIANTEKKKPVTLVKKKTSNDTTTNSSNKGFINITTSSLMVGFICITGVFIGYMIYKIGIIGDIFNR